MISSHCDVTVCVTDGHSVIDLKRIADDVNKPKNSMICKALRADKDKKKLFLDTIKAPNNLLLMNGKVKHALDRLRESHARRVSDIGSLVE
jgi:hypothetical protein